MAKPAQVPSTHIARAPRRTVRGADPRSVRSKSLLREALLRLIDTQSFDKISLREITVEAGLSYPTFFNNYASKEDLFRDLAREQIVDLLGVFRNGEEAASWRPGENICAFITARRSLWQTLLTAGATETMRSEFIQRGRDMASRNPGLGHGFPIDVVTGIVASGMFEIIAWWLARDETYPASQVADMLETLVIEPALHLAPGYFTSRGRGSGVPVRPS